MFTGKKKSCHNHFQ